MARRRITVTIHALTAPDTPTERRLHGVVGRTAEGLWSLADGIYRAARGVEAGGEVVNAAGHKLLQVACWLSDQRERLHRGDALTHSTAEPYEPPDHRFEIYEPADPCFDALATAALDVGFAADQINVCQVEDFNGRQKTFYLMAIDEHGRGRAYSYGELTSDPPPAPPPTPGLGRAEVAFR